MRTGATDGRRHRKPLQYAGLRQVASASDRGRKAERGIVGGSISLPTSGVASTQVFGVQLQESRNSFQIPVGTGDIDASDIGSEVHRWIRLGHGAVAEAVLPTDQLCVKLVAHFLPRGTKAGTQQVMNALPQPF